jgi:hypothetical protein
VPPLNFSPPMPPWHRPPLASWSRSLAAQPPPPSRHHPSQERSDRDMRVHVCCFDEGGLDDRAAHTG